MDLYESIFTPNGILNQEIAREVFEHMPSDGPVVAIIDDFGNCWSNNDERFQSIGLTKEWISRPSERVNDGCEPVITNYNNWSMILWQLATANNKCGYILIGLENHSPEMTLSKLDLAEIIASQILTTANMVEQRDMLKEVQSKVYSIHQN